MTTEADHRSSTAESDTPSSASDFDLEILSGHPTPEELAAVTAVLSAMAEDVADGERRLVTGPSAWERSQRILRSAIVPGPHGWNNFPG